jgi:hypothetical protein
MKLTPEHLKDIVKQELDALLQDLGLLLPYPLQDEPVGNEDPPELLEGKKNKVQIASQIINTMTDEEQGQLFRHYGRFTWATLLQRFRELKSAEKGTK